METMDDFDTSLLIPDVIMEVENIPITTRNESNLPAASDQTSSPFDYNITGCKAQFKLSEEDDRLRRRIFTIDNPVQRSRIHCTACNAHLGSALSNLKNVYVHPLLLVIVCRDCFDFYSSDCFDKDEDGSEMYCRWCGQGGRVICCSGCPMVFCKLCIRINFGAETYAEIRDKDAWKCFVCEPGQIGLLRAHCLQFADYVRKEIARLPTIEDKTSAMHTDHARCCSRPAFRNKRRSRVRDPDYVPDGASEEEAEEESDPVEENSEEDNNHEKEEVNVQRNVTSSLARRIMEIDHPYSKPPAQESPKREPARKNLASAKKKPPPLAPLAQPLVSSTASFRTLLLAAPTPTTVLAPTAALAPTTVPACTSVSTPTAESAPKPAPIQFLLKGQNTSQAQAQNAATSNGQAAPNPFLILTNLQSNSNIKLAMLKNGQKIILTPLGSSQKKENQANLEPIPAVGLRFEQKAAAAKGSVETKGGNTLKVPTGSGVTKIVPRVPIEAAKKTEETSPQQQQQLLQKIPFIFQTRKIPLQNNVPDHQESTDLRTKLQLVEKVIRESALANGAFGSVVLQLQSAFSTAKFAHDYVKLHNGMQEALGALLVRLLESHKELDDGFKSGAGAVKSQKPAQQAQNPMTICPMGQKNCLRVSKVLANKTINQKRDFDGNPK